MLVASRSRLDQPSKREEVRRTGVYRLVGPDPADSSRQLVYVCESDIEESIIGSPAAAHSTGRAQQDRPSAP